jgi:hypothetical protein
VHLIEKSVINMISMLLPVFHWRNRNDRSRWFAISSSHIFAVPVCFRLMGGVAKE